MNGLYLHIRVSVIILTAVYLIFMFSACKSCQNQSGQLKDSDMTIQVMRLQGDNDDSVATFKAMLTPKKMLLDEKTQEEKDGLIYRMDSCFYILSGTKKIYAVLVQPVANGANDSFEYLLQFENTSVFSACKALVYQDKYLNRKKYRLKLTSDNF